MFQSRAGFVSSKRDRNGEMNDAFSQWLSLMPFGFAAPRMPLRPAQLS